MAVLIADDAPDVLALVPPVLGSLEGHTVSTATDGDDALRPRGGQPFDLATVDREMPAIDGLEITKHLRERQGLTVIEPCAADHPRQRRQDRD